MFFRGGIKIFVDCIMDKMWIMQEEQGIDSKERVQMAKNLGEEIRE